MKTTFEMKAPVFMASLLKDFPALTMLDAAAIFGNAGHESGGLEKLQEIAPTVRGSKGGYGWFQWTGPRRKAFEAFCKARRLAPADDDANYAFLCEELRGPEAKALTAVMRAKTLDTKTVAFENAFERSGVKHYPARKAWALKALHAYEAAHGAAPAPTISPVPIALPATPAAKPTGGLPSWLGRWFGKASPTPPVAASEPAPGDPVILGVQKRLQELGYNEFGLADGMMGPKTAAAILTFRSEQDPALSPNPVIDDELHVALAKAHKRVLAPERTQATASTLREGGSKTVESFDAIGLIGKVLFGGGILGGVDQTGALDKVKDAADSALSTFQTIQALVGGVLSASQWAFRHWWVFALIAGVVVLYKVSIGILDLVIKFRTGILQRPSV